jgi:hypothetical protein
MKFKLRLLLVLLFAFGIVTHAVADPEDMAISTWDPGCEHTMTTNHFELAPGQSVEIPLDLSACADPYEGMLFFGYHTTKNSSRQLTARNSIRLTVVASGQETLTEQEWSSDSGYLYIAFSNATAAAISNPTGYVIYAENMNKKKTLRIRLRSSAIW